MKKTLSIFLFITFAWSVNAQYFEEMQIDSLQRIIDNPANKDADRIDPLARLSKLYESQGDSAAATNMLNRARTLALREKDSKYMIYVYNQELMNCINTHPRKITRAYQIIDSMYIAIQKTSDSEAQALGYDYIGSAKFLVNAEDNLEDCFKSLALAEKLPEKSIMKHRILCDIYSYLSRKYVEKDSTNANKYLNLMQQAAEKSGDKNYICRTMIEKLYFDITYHRADKNLLEQEFTTLDNFLLENRNTLSSDVYGRSILILIPAYAHIQDAQFKMKLNKHIEILREISGTDFKSKNILLASELAYNMRVQTDYTKAIDLSQQKIALDENRNPELLWGDYYYLATLYTETEQFKQANEAWEQTIFYLSKYQSAKLLEQYQLTEIKFDVEKKERQLEQQRNRVFTISIIAILVVIILATLVWLINKQRKINELEKEKAEILSQRALEEKERIGKKLIVNTTELERKNRLLEKVKDMDKEQIDRAVRYEQKKSNSTSDYTKLFNEISLEFYNRLQAKASPNKLTQTDLKYCAYILLRMSNKELANVMNLEYSAVVMHKYRLKKKLHLSKNEYLEEFIVAISPHLNGI